LNSQLLQKLLHGAFLLNSQLLQKLLHGAFLLNSFCQKVITQQFLRPKIMALIQEGDTVVLDENGERKSFLKLKRKGCVALCHHLSCHNVETCTGVLPAILTAVHTHTPCALYRQARIGKSQVCTDPFIGAPYGAVFTLSADGKSVQRVTEW